jgi:hypothetical protein
MADEIDGKELKLQSPTCMRCGCEMQRGVLADYGDVDCVFSLRWHPVPLPTVRPSFWERFLNLGIKGKVGGFEASIYRCESCGRLEFFAL